MSESKVVLKEVIQYLKEASEYEKNRRFNKFVEGAITLLQHVTQNEDGLGLFIDVLVDITDEYLRTKNQYVLIEALRFFEFDELNKGDD